MLLAAACSAVLFMRRPTRASKLLTSAAVEHDHGLVVHGSQEVLVRDAHDAAVIEQGRVLVVRAEQRRHLGSRGEALVAGDVVRGVPTAKAEAVHHVGGGAVARARKPRAGGEGRVVDEVVGNVLDVVLVGAVDLVLAGFAADRGVGAVTSSQRWQWQQGGEEEAEAEAPCPKAHSILYYLSVVEPKL